MAESSPKGQKTLEEKEKLLVTSNFSFSCSVFKRFVIRKGLKTIEEEVNSGYGPTSSITYFDFKRSLQKTSFTDGCFDKNRY